jgi:hypothetical protein
MIVLGKPKRCKMSQKVTTRSAESIVIGLYSIHLVNLSMATNTCVKPPGAVVKGPIMSRPQHGNGHEGGMGDEVMSRDMSLFAKELAVGTASNECFGIYQSSWPVETRSKCLADYCARSRVVPAHAFMNLLEYLFALLPADTLHEYA